MSATLAFTKTEQRIVDMLRANQGAWVPKDALIVTVYGFLPKRGQPGLSVRVHISSIRKKLGAERERLESCPHRQRGYRWIDADAAKAAQ